MSGLAQDRILIRFIAQPSSPEPFTTPPVRRMMNLPLFCTDARARAATLASENGYTLGVFIRGQETLSTLSADCDAQSRLTP